MQTNTFPIADIQIKDRAREVDAAWVEVLADLIAHQGLIHPVRLWKDADDVVWLVAGMHRLEACKKLDRTGVEYTFSNAANWDEARLEEVLENLGRNELNILDRAQHLYELKKAYEKVYPETKAGNAGAEAKHGRANDIMSFASDASEKVGLSERHIQRAVKLWKDLSKPTRDMVRGTWVANHQAALMSLAALTPKMQAKILDVLFDENTSPKSVADAIEFIENGKLQTSEQRSIAGALKSFKKMPDTVFDMVLSSQRERVAKWAKGQGII